MLLRSEVVASRPVIDTAQTDLMKLLNENSYDKGGWVLHMLQGLVGDSAFYGGLRDYIAAHRHGNAMTDDLRTAVEARAKQPLGWFFDQWLRRPGFASLTTSWHYDAAASRVVLDVEQGARFGYYRVPLTVEVTDAAGAAHRVTVDIAATAATRVELPLALRAAPRAVTIDPDVQLLAELKSR